MKVYTYYEDIKFKHQERLINLWKNSWEKQGFEAIVLSKEDAKKNSFYEKFINEINKIYQQITNKPLSKYGLSCWLRWLAYATQPDEKFYVCDYDVINHNFKPQEPHNDLHFMEGDCPCIASGTSKQFDDLSHMFIDVTTKNIELFTEMYSQLKFVNFHDQEFFILCHKANLDLFKATRDRKLLMGTPKVGSFWEKQLVHYSHDMCGKFCESKSIMFDESQRCNIIEESLKLTEEKLFLSECIEKFAPVGGGVRSVHGSLNQLGETLTLIGIKNLLPSINHFLKLIGMELPKIEIYDDSRKTETSEKLKELFNRYGSDKSYSHNYHLVYGEVFSKLDATAPLNILEIGLGSQNPSIPSRMSGKFSVGSSIRAYKEYFPNSQIFGADVDKDALFTEDRIKTSYVDQLNSTTFEEMHKNFNSPTYDLIIEDGLHSFVASLNTLNFALKYIKKGGIVVLEDLGNAGNLWNMITSLLLARGYRARLIDSKGLMLVVYI